MSTIVSDWRSPRAVTLLAVFLVVVIGVGAFIGISTAPGEWYAALEKPPVQPAQCGVRAGLVHALCNDRHRRLAHVPARAERAGDEALVRADDTQLAVVAGLVHAALAVAGLRRDLRDISADPDLHRAELERGSGMAGLSVPYAAWVGFASLLNLSIAVLN